MNLLLICTSEVVALNAVAVQYVRRVNSTLLAALQIAELLVVVSGNYATVVPNEISFTYYLT